MDTATIWNTYHQDIERFILSKINDKMVAEDLTQEVFTKVHLKRETLKKENKIKSWIFTIARNVVMDYFRKELKETDFSIENITIDEETPLHTEKDCLPGLINNLPEKYKIPLYLSDIEGIKQKDIAKQLNLPLPTIKSQIQRGRKLIIEGYMECCDYKLNEEGKLVGEMKEKANCKICNHK